LRDIAFYPSLPYIGSLGLPTQYGIIFAVFALGLAHSQPWFLVNPVIGWIGKVSFSGYLVRLWVISTFSIPHSNYLEAFLVLTAVTIAISSLTYRVIEEPCNRLGRYVARRAKEAGSERVAPSGLAPAAIGQHPIVQEIATGEK